MKKLLAFMLTTMLLFALVSCGDPYDYNLNDYISEDGSYKGISVSEKEINEQLESAIEKLRNEETSKVVVTDRAIKDGDIIDMKYEGRLEGESETFKGGVGTEKEFIIGDNNFIEGFDKAMIDHGGPNEKVFEINVTFPKNYGTKDLAGKKAIFKITVNSIKEVVKPEFNDEYVKEKTIYNSVEEYRKQVTRNIKANLAFEAVVEKFVVKKFPEKELKKAYESQVEYYKSFANMLGVDLKTYVTSYQRIKMDEFWEDCAKAAAVQVKQDMVLYYILRKEGIKITDEEYNEGALEIAKTYGYETVKAFIKAKNVDKDDLYTSVLLSKVKYFLADNSILDEDTDETTDTPTESTTVETDESTSADTDESTTT